MNAFLEKKEGGAVSRVMENIQDIILTEMVKNQRDTRFICWGNVPDGGWSVWEWERDSSLAREETHKNLKRIL